MSWKDKVEIIDRINLKYKGQIFSYNQLAQKCSGTRSIVQNNEVIKLTIQSEGSNKDEAIENMLIEIDKIL